MSVVKDVVGNIVKLTCGSVCECNGRNGRCDVVNSLYFPLKGETAVVDRTGF